VHPVKAWSRQQPSLAARCAKLVELTDELAVESLELDHPTSQLCHRASEAVHSQLLAPLDPIDTVNLVTQRRHRRALVDGLSC